MTSTSNCLKNSSPCVFLVTIVILLLIPNSYADHTYQDKVEFADHTYQDKVEFAVSVQEILANLNAAEVHYNYGNLDIARHIMGLPFLETYPKMIDELEPYPGYQATLELVLHVVKNVNMGITQEELYSEITLVESILRVGEDLVIEQELQNDPNFKMQIVIHLLDRAEIKILEFPILENYDFLISYQQCESLLNRAHLILNTINTN